jgi:nucleotide-binding universal stress UspA family protein
MAIVVGVDGSDPSNDALRWGLAEARLRGTELHAVRAWEYPFVPPTVDPFPGGPMPEGMAPVDTNQLRSSYEAGLAEMVRDVAGGEPGVDVVLRLLEGHPVEVLVEESRTAELVVLGSRGHGGFTGLLLGSVSQACVHHSHCPVVIVRGAE